MANRDLKALAKLVAEIMESSGKSQVSKPKADRLESKDAAIIRGFNRKGIKNVVLMDRSDKSKPFNVRPYKTWIELGRVVKRGETGVRGLFHISQTEELVSKTNNSAAVQATA